MRRVCADVGTGFTAESINGRLVALATACCVFFGAASGAAALTLDEFDRLPGYQKENFISTVLHFQHYRYSGSSETAGKARCMFKLDRIEAQNGDPYLQSLIMRDLEIVRANIGGHRTVERVIHKVIERECKDY